QGPPQVNLLGHQGPVVALAYSPDGQFLATGEGSVVRLWNPDNPRQLPVVLPPGHKGWVTALTFRRDGKRLASANRTGIVIVWDVAERKWIYQWQLGGPVHGVAFAADGRHLATANGNGTAYILRLSL